MPDEWNHERELPWGLLQYPEHSGILDWVSALNHLYHDEPALHRGDNSADGFQVDVGNDDANSVLAFLRLATGCRPVLVVCNFTAVPRTGYRIGVPVAGGWSVLLNGDDRRFGGSGVGNDRVETDAVRGAWPRRFTAIDVPPLTVCFLASPTTTGWGTNSRPRYLAS